MIGVIGFLEQSIFFLTILYTSFHVIMNYQLLYRPKVMEETSEKVKPTFRCGAYYESPEELRSTHM